MVGNSIRRYGMNATEMNVDVRCSSDINGGDQNGGDVECHDNMC